MFLLNTEFIFLLPFSFAIEFKFLLIVLLINVEFVTLALIKLLLYNVPLLLLI
jgi:hypothetical protein